MKYLYSSSHYGGEEQSLSNLSALSLCNTRQEVEDTPKGGVVGGRGKRMKEVHLFRLNYN